MAGVRALGLSRSGFSRRRLVPRVFGAGRRRLAVSRVLGLRRRHRSGLGGLVTRMGGLAGGGWLGGGLVPGVLRRRGLGVARVLRLR